MIHFDVYNHPVHGNKAIKKGFSWPAFFFLWLWAFIKHLWLAGLGCLVFTLLVGFSRSALQATGVQDYQELATFIYLAQITVWVWFGANGNKFLGKKLVKQGYRHIKTVKAPTSDAAIIEIFGTLEQQGTV